MKTAPLWAVFFAIVHRKGAKDAKVVGLSLRDKIVWNDFERTKCGSKGVRQEV